MSSVFFLNAWDNDRFDCTWAFSDRESAEEFLEALAPDHYDAIFEIFRAKRGDRVLHLMIEECPLDPPLDTIHDYL